MLRTFEIPKKPNFLQDDFLGQFIAPNQFVDINLSHRFDLYLKLEGLNPAGSIKLKTALSLITESEQSGEIKSDSTIIESSSGNLGIALAMVCASRRYAFKCVLDPNASPESISTIKALGGIVVIVREKDKSGGYLNSRIDYIQHQLKHDPKLVWVNQYANPANSGVHATTTAAEIFSSYPNCDYLFVGAGTTGTLMGCAEYKHANGLPTKIIAVDIHGSVTFGSKPRPRRIPGLGTSRKPEICSAELIDEIIWVSEEETIRQCRSFALNYGMLLGGSSGSVLAGIASHADKIPEGSTVVAISPDMGSKYLNSVYSDGWVREHYPGALGESPTYADKARLSV